MVRHDRSAGHPSRCRDDARAAYIVYGINREEPFDRSGVDFQEPGATFSDPDAGGTLGNVIYSDQASRGGRSSRLRGGKVRGV